MIETFLAITTTLASAVLLWLAYRRGPQWRNKASQDYRRRVLRGDLDNGRDGAMT